MIRGSVSQDLEPVIAVDVQDRDGVFHSLEVVLDTGFTGYLVFSSVIIQQLRLTYRGRRSVILATGEQSTVDAYAALVSWHGRARNVLVMESSSESLIGMSLLAGSRVTFDVHTGGEVLVEDV